MMAGVSSVALVVRLKSMWRPCSAARWLRVRHHFLQQRKIHQRFAAEERDVDRAPVARFGEQKIDRSLGRFEVHELRLAFGRGDLVGAEFVAVLAGEIALVGEVHHQRLNGKNVGKRLAAAPERSRAATITFA